MPPFITPLSPDEERAFQQWVRANDIKDADAPESKYDYRGFWKANPQFRHRPGEHFTDTYKQPGHLSFSNESQYATPANYGGRWDEDTYLPQLSTSRQSVNPQQLGASTFGLAMGDTNVVPADVLATTRIQANPNLIESAFEEMPIPLALAVRNLNALGMQRKKRR